MNGSCETPRCPGAAQVITPEGYVCRTCAERIRAHLDDLERRQRGLRRAGR